MGPIIDILHRDRTGRPCVNDTFIVFLLLKEVLVGKYIPILGEQLSNLRADAYQEVGEI